MKAYSYGWIVLLLMMSATLTAQNVVLETSTAENPKWYILKCAGTENDAQARFRKVITYLPNHPDKGIKGVDLSLFTEINDSILWRFEIDPKGTGKIAIISKYDECSIKGSYRKVSSVSSSMNLAVTTADKDYAWTCSDLKTLVRNGESYSCYGFSNTATTPATLLHMAGTNVDCWFNSYDDEAKFFYLIDDDYFEKNINVVLETSTADNPKWYMLKCAGVTGDTHARFQKIVTYLPNHPEKGIKGIDLSSFTEINDSILWRFEVDTQGSNKVAIISKYDGNSIKGSFQIVGAISSSVNLAVVTPEKDFVWTLSVPKILVRNGTSYSCYGFTNTTTTPATLLHMAGTNVDCWFNSYDDEAKFFHLINDDYSFTEIPTATTDKKDDHLIIFTQNKRVFTNGHSESLRVFTLNGRECDPHRELSNGVYIARVGSFVRKIMIH